MELDNAVISLGALGEATRLRIFRRLVEAGPAGLFVGQIAAHLNAGAAVAPATLSFHLKTLLHAGLLLARKEKQYVRYLANFAAINGLVAYLTENCCGGHPERCAAGSCRNETTHTEEPRHAA